MNNTVCLAGFSLSTGTRQQTDSVRDQLVEEGAKETDIPLWVQTRACVSSGGQKHLLWWNQASVSVVLQHQTLAVHLGWPDLWLRTRSGSQSAPDNRISIKATLISWSWYNLSLPTLSNKERNNERWLGVRSLQPEGFSLCRWKDVRRKEEIDETKKAFVLRVNVWSH